MPEGDTIHRAARKLGAALTGTQVESLELPRTTVQTEALIGSTVAGAEARGKNLLVHLGDVWTLHVHLKMNGRIFLRSRSAERLPRPSSRTVVQMRTERHELEVVDAPVARLIRRADLMRDLHFRGLGPDLLTERPALDEVMRRMRKHQARELGEALLDQSIACGIGNVWKSELCFNARLDPFAQVSAFSDQELMSVFESAHKQMRAEVYAPRSRLPNPFTAPAYRRTARIDARKYEAPLSVYERAGEACYDCGTQIIMRRQGTRSTYLCPRCQPTRSTP